MSLLHAIILALVQAFTEFLPVSSTAHLILFPWLLGWPDPGLAFDVALHAGTLLAVILYFFKDWLTLIVCGLGGKYPANAPAEEVSQHRRMFWFMVVGTIPAAILGKLFHHQIEDTLRTPVIIGISLIVVGLLMWAADSLSGLTRKLEQSNWGDAIGIGAAQAVALWPGVSRSGITITTGLFRKFTREAATRFSFLLSAPVIAGAVASEFPKLLKLHKAGGLELPLSTLFISVLVSGIAGYFVIAFFIKFLQTRTLRIFVIYRLLLGLLVLFLAFYRGAH
ncbi:MAG: undecaprenyl-diphosphatase UppP [Acidobacteria bacterium]|nr:undecaprenyl-diphosphatase UppP [Acidobacteriota bacterium]MBS1865622.1 undecaprenyl-diphosphatase UppP [Acidobacteriota bacterium]